MFESLSKLAETPTESKSNPLLNEETSDNKGICQAQHTQVTFFCVCNYVSEESFYRGRDAVQTTQNILHNLLSKSDAQLGYILNFARELI